jgi:hypothetical protein
MARYNRVIARLLDSMESRGQGELLKLNVRIYNGTEDNPRLAYMVGGEYGSDVQRCDSVTDALQFFVGLMMALEERRATV